MSNQSGDIQDVKNALKAVLLSAEFLLVLAAVDADKAVTIATPGPTQVFTGEKQVKTDQGYPVVELIGHRTQFVSNDEQVKDTVHEIDITWTHVGDDELLVTAQLERMVKATRNILWPETGATTLPGVNATPTLIVSEDYSPLMQGRAAGTFVKGSAIAVQIRTLSL